MRSPLHARGIRFWQLVGLGPLASLAFGCGGQSDAQAKQMTELTREVLRLTTDNALLSNRVDSLEVKLQRAGAAAKKASPNTTPSSPHEDRPELSVVRLAPGSGGALETVTDQGPGEEVEAPRPLLKSTPQGEIVEEVPPEPAAPKAKEPKGKEPKTSSAGNPPSGLDRALSLVRAQKPQEALDALTSFSLRHPNDARATEATYWRGRCQQSLGRHRQAVEQFSAVAATQDPLVADALLGLYVSHANLGDGKSATLAKTRLLEEFPQADAAKKVR